MAGSEARSWSSFAFPYLSLPRWPGFVAKATSGEVPSHAQPHLRLGKPHSWHLPRLHLHLCRMPSAMAGEMPILWCRTETLVETYVKMYIFLINFFLSIYDGASRHRGSDTCPNRFPASTVPCRSSLCTFFLPGCVWVKKCPTKHARSKFLLFMYLRHRPPFI